MVRRFRKNYIGAVLAIGVSFASAPLALAETLSDAMASAYKHSGLLEQNQALLRAADEDVAIAQAALRPTLSYAIQHGWTDPNASISGNSAWGTSAQLTAEFLIFNFGRGKAAVAAQKEVVLATRDSLTSVEQQILLRAVKAYVDVRSAVENAQLQSNSVRVLTQELRAANDRFEVGEVTQTDVALAQARLAAARASEASARGDLAIAREEYRAATGDLPGSLSVPPALPMTAKTLDAAKGIARQRHPDILAAQHNVAASDLLTEISMAAMKPALVGNAQTKWQDAGGQDFFSNSVGVALQGTIYSGGKLSAEYRKAIAKAEAARAGLHQARLAVDQGVANAWAQLAIAAASLEATERQIRASRVALRGAREEATLGSRTTLDVLNAEQELLNAEASRITAQSNQYLAAYSLLSSMGLLTAEHLKLGVVTYDPEAYFNTVKSAPVHRVSPQGKRLDSLLEALGKN
ncbi:TolC family outer membrane protein [Aliiroseovarius sp. S1339]|uniref:TolC family outer membrane protein n=1 Tax=Aliiroseovarius sp. S1339 TaxID=2936990 RepID=UPI0020BEE0A9|nr:TolC family outer membrane protein [Aliiroseovarius sp. S1339]MCK8463002.1 TolC family outer membrane protein [Aliiroseovarius sp. S1339]